MDQDKEGKKVEQNRLQDYLSGETNDEKNQRSQDQHPGQENLSGESEIDEKIPDEKQDLENKVLSGEFRWMRRRHRHDLEERAVSSTTSSTDDDSRNSGMDHLFRQELEFGIRTVRTSDTHATSGNSGKGPGQRGVSGS